MVGTEKGFMIRIMIKLSRNPRKQTESSCAGMGKDKYSHSIIYKTMTHEEIYNDLITNGYHIGDLSELLNERTGYNEGDLLTHTQTFRNTLSQKELRYDYRNNFTAQNDSAVYLNKPGYTGPVPTDEERMHDVPYDRIPRRKEFIKAVQAGGGGIRTTQQWSKLALNNLPEDGNRISEMDLWFNGLIRTHLSLIYPELRAVKDSFTMRPAFTLYQDGDFSEVHYDGVNPGRTCVMLIYLADPSLWQEGDGGELVIGHHIEKNDEQIQYFLPPYEKCKPVYGNYAIMDFTHWNMGHSIEEVKNGFNRIAIQTFADINPA
jgi:hypothetical protein